MPLKSHADEWIKLRSKSAKRARAAEYMAAYGRPSTQDSLALTFGFKRKKALNDLTIFTSSRFMFRAQMFKHFDTLSIKRRAYVENPDLFKDIPKLGPRMVISIRSFRLHGVPLVFRRDDQKFWSHSSGYIPRDEIEYAKASGVQFKAWRVWMTPTGAMRMTAAEMKENHLGFWHIDEHHTDLPGAPMDGMTAHILYCSEDADAVFFRMRYSFPLIEAERSPLHV